MDFRKSLFYGASVAGLVGLLYFSGCESNFRRDTTLYGSMPKSLIGGSYDKIKSDKDFDGDGIRDTYIIKGNGKIYTTRSSEIIEQLEKGIKNPEWQWYLVE